MMTQDLTGYRVLPGQPFCNGHSACCEGAVPFDRVCVWSNRVPEFIRNEVLNDRPVTTLWIVDD